MALNAPWKFLRMYLLDRGYRDGFAGFILAAVGSFYVFLKHAVLWERRSLRARGIDPDRVPRHHRGPEWRPPRALPESAEAEG